LFNFSNAFVLKRNVKDFLIKFKKRLQFGALPHFVAEHTHNLFAHGFPAVRVEVGFDCHALRMTRFACRLAALLARWGTSEKALRLVQIVKKLALGKMENSCYNEDCF